MPRPELDLIRQRYSYACGYCGITEVSTGGMLTLDHYRPLSAGGDDSLDNLVYACVRCNQYKHTYWPTDDTLGLDAFRREGELAQPLAGEGEDRVGNRRANRTNGRFTHASRLAVPRL
jgi:5-methylcytosine-specific restriction endonuclease McrA